MDGKVKIAEAEITIKCFGKTTVLIGNIDAYKDNTDFIRFMTECDDAAAKHETFISELFGAGVTQGEKLAEY